MIVRDASQHLPISMLKFVVLSQWCWIIKHYHPKE